MLFRSQQGRNPAAMAGQELGHLLFEMDQRPLSGSGIDSLGRAELDDDWRLP